MCFAAEQGDPCLQLLGQTIKQIQTELAVSSAKSRGGGLQDTEALIANMSVSIDKTRAQCMKAVEQVDAGRSAPALQFAKLFEAHAA